MADNQKTLTPCERFTAYLHASNMRVTNERLSIIEVIAKHAGLFSIDELHSMMDREAFPVSTATLYNTIELLIDAGLVKCLKLPDRQSALYRLDTANTPHVYMICEQCGSVNDNSQKALTRYINKYEFATFAPRTFTLCIYGLCRKCQKLNRKISTNKTR